MLCAAKNSQVLQCTDHCRQGRFHQTTFGALSLVGKGIPQRIASRKIFGNKKRRRSSLRICVPNFLLFRFRSGDQAGESLRDLRLSIVVMVGEDWTSEEIQDQGYVR
jgi:hypothetical protein